MTRKQLWEALPEGLRVNEVRFREAVESGVGSLWTKEERARARGGPLYRFGVNGAGED